MYQRFILLTGCSGGGKSTLLQALAGVGHHVVPEPGRRIVEEETHTGGRALPWNDLAAFAQRAVTMARADLAQARNHRGPVFFDRGLIDAAVALDYAGGPAFTDTLGGQRHYDDRVFVAPPWPELYETDDTRRHSFDAARDEHDRLLAALDGLGYLPVRLPKASVADRVAFVLETLQRS